MPNAALDMTSVPVSSLDRERAERFFFLVISVLVALTVAVGFGSWTIRGMVVRPLPIHVHVHAGLCVAWIAIFIAQTALIYRNHAQLHRRTGWLALGLAMALVFTGGVTALESLRLGRVPPFFPGGIFLAINFLELVAFSGLLGAAILLRRRTDWHRRLMLGATLCLTAPAWGRILPMQLLGPWGTPAIMGVLCIYLAVAMGFDLFVRRRIHPAHFATFLALAIQSLGVGPLGTSAPFLRLAEMLSDG